MTKKDKITTEDNWMSIEVLALSAHLPIDIQPTIGKQWVLNGYNNSNFTMFKDSYDDSPTNSSIINSYVNYIYADGFIDKNEKDEFKMKTNISKHLPKNDARLICQDYKMFGAYAIQVIWNSAKKESDKRPIMIKHFKMHKLGLSIDEYMEVNGYWYSFDWNQQSKYPPKFYPKYDGTYKGFDVELLVIQRPSTNDFYSQPDWVSGLRWAQIEGEISNWSYNHLKNGFQGTKVVNCNSGIPPTEELKKEYKDKIIKKLTGTDNANKVIVSFNASADQGIVVTEVPITEINQQYVQFSEEAKQQLISAHSSSPVLFSNEKGGGGLSNNADELEQATAMIYRKSIRPMQEVIIDGLASVFVDINPDIELGILDFPTFGGDKREVVSADSKLVPQETITDLVN